MPPETQNTLQPIGFVMTRYLFIFLIIGSLLTAGQVGLAADPPEFSSRTRNVIDNLVGESLSYDVSFLWFDRLAVGTIRLSHGDQPGTYLAELQAKTRGFAALVTKNRVEMFRTLMELGPGGMLRPLAHSSHSIKGKDNQVSEKITSYTFDYEHRQVKYQKIKNNVIRADEILPLSADGPVFDILSAFYNLRLGNFGPLSGEQIHMPTFHRKGIEEIVVDPVDKNEYADSRAFDADNILCKVRVDPEVFKTDGRDLLISFDADHLPQKAVIKNVIGLGDVTGVLRSAGPPLQALN